MTTATNDETADACCDMTQHLDDMERRLACHVVGSIAVGTMILLGAMLALTSVLLQHG